MPSLPQGSVPKPEIEPRTPSLQEDSLPSEPPGKPEILEWVAYPFSRGSFHPGIDTGSPALQVVSLPAELSGELMLDNIGYQMWATAPLLVIAVLEHLKMKTVAPVKGYHWFLKYLFILFGCAGPLVVICRIFFSCGMWDLVPRPRMEPGAPALGVWSLSHGTTRKPLGYHCFYE